MRISEEKSTVEKFLDQIPYISLHAVEEAITAPTKKIKIMTFQQNKDGDVPFEPLGDLQGVEYLYLVIESAVEDGRSLVCYFEFVERPVRDLDEQELSNVPASIVCVLLSVLIVYLLLELTECCDFPVHRAFKQYNRQLALSINNITASILTIFKT